MAFCSFCEARPEEARPEEAHPVSLHPTPIFLNKKISQPCSFAQKMLIEWIKCKIQRNLALPLDLVLLPQRLFLDLFGLRQKLPPPQDDLARKAPCNALNAELSQCKRGSRGVEGVCFQLLPLCGTTRLWHHLRQCGSENSGFEAHQIRAGSGNGRARPRCPQSAVQLVQSQFGQSQTAGL